jgi:hypothetical protein
MASRLDFTPVWLGHWRGLSMRTHSPTGYLHYHPDRVARAFTLLVPAAAFVGALYWLRDALPTWSLPADFTAVAVGAAALLSASLVAALSQLAGWRDRLSDRDRVSEQPVKAMIDEAVAHVALALLESVLMLATAVASLALAGWPARLFTAATCALGAHVIYLFLLLVPRLYSAYVQRNDVDENLDGYSRGVASRH